MAVIGAGRNKTHAPKSDDRAMARSPTSKFAVLGALFVAMMAQAAPTKRPRPAPADRTCHQYGTSFPSDIRSQESPVTGSPRMPAEPGSRSRGMT